MVLESVLLINMPIWHSRIYFNDLWQNPQEITPTDQTQWSGVCRKKSQEWNQEYSSTETLNSQTYVVYIQKWGGGNT